MKFSNFFSDPSVELRTETFFQKIRVEIERKREVKKNLAKTFGFVNLSLIKY